MATTTPTATAVPARSSLSGALLIIGAAVSLQCGAVFAAQLFPVLGSWGTNLLRLVFSAALLVAAFRPRCWRWSGAQWRSILLFGAAMSGMNGFFYAAIDRIPLGIAVSIEFIGPLLLSAVLSRSVRNLIWVGLAAGGMVLLAIDSTHGVEALDPLGVVFALIAAVFWAGYILAGARAGSMVPGNGGLAMALVVATLITLPIGIGGAAQAFVEPRLLLIALVVAVLASLVPYTLEFIALQRLPKSVFGVLASLEPAIATFFGWLLLHQDAGPLRIAAVVLVVLASVGAALGKRETVEVTVESLTTGPIDLPVLPSQIGQQEPADDADVVGREEAVRRGQAD